MFKSFTTLAANPSVSCFTVFMVSQLMASIHLSFPLCCVSFRTPSLPEITNYSLRFLSIVVICFLTSSTLAFGSWSCLWCEVGVWFDFFPVGDILSLLSGPSSLPLSLWVSIVLGSVLGTLLFPSACGNGPHKHNTVIVIRARVHVRVHGAWKFQAWSCRQHVADFRCLILTQALANKSPKSSSQFLHSHLP